MFSISTKAFFCVSNQRKKDIQIQLNFNKNFFYWKNILISVYNLIYLLKQEEIRIQSVSYDLSDFYLIRMKL